MPSYRPTTALSLLWLLLVALAGVATATDRVMKHVIVATDTTLGIGDSSIFITDSTISAGVTLTVDMEQMEFGNGQSAVRVFIFATHIFPSAKLIVRGLSDPFSTPIPVHLVISGCTFLNSSQLLFVQTSYPRRSSLIVMNSFFTSNGSDVDTSFRVSSLALVDKTAFKIMNNSFSIQNAVIVTTYRLSCICFDLVGTVDSASVLYILNNSFAMLLNTRSSSGTALLPVTIAAVYFTTMQSVVDTFAITSFSIVQIEANQLALSAPTGAVAAFLYEAILVVSATSFWRHVGNVYRVLDCSTLQLGVFLSLAGGTWNTLTVADASVFAVLRDEYTVTSDGASRQTCPGGLYRSDLYISVTSKSLLQFSNCRVDLREVTDTNTAATAFDFGVGATVFVDLTSQLFVGLNIVRLGPVPLAAFKTFLVLASMTACYVGDNEVVGGEYFIGASAVTGGGTTIDFQHFRCNLWNALEITSYDAAVVATPATVTTVSACSTCHLGFDCFPANTDSIDGSTCTCLCTAGTHDSYCLPIPAIFGLANFSSKTVTRTRTVTYPDVTGSDTGTSDLTMTGSFTDSRPSPTADVTFTFGSVSATASFTPTEEKPSRSFTVTASGSFHTDSPRATLTETVTVSPTRGMRTASTSITPTMQSDTFRRSMTDSSTGSPLPRSRTVTPSYSTTPSPSETKTRTASPSASDSPSSTLSVVASASFTGSHSFTVSDTLTASVTESGSSTVTFSETDTGTTTPTETRFTGTVDFSASPSPTSSLPIGTLSTLSVSFELTPSPVTTRTARSSSPSTTGDATLSWSATPTATESSSTARTISGSPTGEPSDTDTRSPESTHTETLIPSPTLTRSPSATESMTGDITATMSRVLSPSHVRTLSPTRSATVDGTITRSGNVSDSYTISSAVTQTDSPTVTELQTETRSLSMPTFSEDLSPTRSRSVSEQADTGTISSSRTSTYSLSEPRSQTYTASRTVTDSPRAASKTTTSTQTTTLTLSSTRSLTREATMSRTVSDNISVTSTQSPTPYPSSTATISKATKSAVISATGARNSTSKSPSDSITPSPSTTESPSPTNTTTLTQQASVTFSRSANTLRISSSKTPTITTVSMTPVPTPSRTMVRTPTPTETFSDTESSDLTLSATVTVTPPPTRTHTTTETYVEPAPNALLAVIVRLFSDDNINRCSWLMAVAITTLIGIVVVQAFLSWRMRVGCERRIKGSSWKKISQWRSLLVHHCYISVLLPCHYHCMWAHTLVCANHMLLVLFFFYGMIALGYHGGVPIKQTLIVFIPLFLAHLPRPMMHYFFFLVTFSEEGLEAAWVDLCNNNGQYLKSSSDDDDDDEDDGNAVRRFHNGATEFSSYNFPTTDRAIAVNVLDDNFSVDSPRIVGSGGGGKRWLDMDSDGFDAMEDGGRVQPADPDSVDFGDGDADDIDIDALIKANYFNSFKKPQREDTDTADDYEDADSDDGDYTDAQAIASVRSVDFEEWDLPSAARDAAAPVANDKPMGKKSKKVRRKRAQSDAEISRHVDDAIRANLEGRTLSTAAAGGSRSASAKQPTASSMAAGAADPAVLREVEESLALAISNNLPKLADLKLADLKLHLPRAVADVSDVENVDISAGDLLPDVSEDPREALRSGGGDRFVLSSQGSSSRSNTGQQRQHERSFRALNSFVAGYDRSDDDGTGERTTISSGAVKLSMGPLTDRSRALSTGKLAGAGGGSSGEDGGPAQRGQRGDGSVNESRQLYSIDDNFEDGGDAMRYATSEGGSESNVDGDDNEADAKAASRRRQSDADALRINALLLPDPPRASDAGSSVASDAIFFEKKYFLAPAETWYFVGGVCGFIFLCGEVIGLSLVAAGAASEHQCHASYGMMLYLFLADFCLMEPLYMLAMYFHRLVCSGEDDALFSELHPIIGERREHLIPPPIRKPSVLADSMDLNANDDDAPWVE